MSNRSVPSAFVKSVLQNGVGRYVCQLQRITLKFCKNQAGSRGLRDFIENDLLEFTRSNPGIAVYLKPRRHRPADLYGEYLNGEHVSFPVNNYTHTEVRQWIEHMRTRQGQMIVRLRKSWHTDSPSIQGIWTPTTNRDSVLNITEVTAKELSECQNIEKSATDQLLEMAKNLREQENLVIKEEN